MLFYAFYHISNGSSLGELRVIAVMRFYQIGREWVDLKIPRLGDRTTQSNLLGIRVAGDRHYQIPKLSFFRTLTVNMKPISNLGCFEFAEVSVNLWKPGL